MLKRKKALIITLAAIAATIGITAGTAFAQDEVEGPEEQRGAMMERVIEIYESKTGVAIDPEILKDSFAEAQEEMRAEAMEERLARAVEEGLLAQEEADELKEWWEARPEVLPGGGPFRGGPGGRFGPQRGGFGPRGGGCPGAETAGNGVTF